MIKIKVKFSLATAYIGSEVSENMEFEFDESMSDQEIHDEINEAYETWLSERNYGCIGEHEIKRSEEE